MRGWGGSESGQACCRACCRPGCRTARPGHAVAAEPDARPAQDAGGSPAFVKVQDGCENHQFLRGHARRGGRSQRPAQGVVLEMQRGGRGFREAVLNRAYPGSWTVTSGRVAFCGARAPASFPNDIPLAPSSLNHGLPGGLRSLANCRTPGPICTCRCSRFGPRLSAWPTLTQAG